VPGVVSGVNDNVPSFYAMSRSIGFLVFPGFQLLDASGPLATFEAADYFHQGAYRLTLLASAAGAVASSAGVTMNAEAIGDAPPLDTLIVAGGLGTRSAARDPGLIAAVRRVAARARRVASVCSGTYLLAEAGLLDGRRATTHWSRSRDFVRRYPQIRLEPDRIFIRDGNVWSSAGVTAGIDLSLALIAEDVGESVARKVAQELVVYRRRPSGQSQFSTLLDLERPEGRFGELLSWAAERLDRKLTVRDLASQAAMSERNFVRRFTEETGTSPAKAIERLRLEAARAKVEAGIDPIEQIAGRAGFGDPERMRRAFLRAYGQPPQALRRAAR
jgi:transcriptional regulator GlxA family with amidase domain